MRLPFAGRRKGLFAPTKHKPAKVPKAHLRRELGARDFGGYFLVSVKSQSVEGKYSRRTPLLYVHPRIRLPRRSPACSPVCWHLARERLVSAFRDGVEAGGSTPGRRLVRGLRSRYESPHNGNIALDHSQWFRQSPCVHLPFRGCTQVSSLVHDVRTSQSGNALREHLPGHPKDGRVGNARSHRRVGESQVRSCIMLADGISS